MKLLVIATFALVMMGAHTWFCRELKKHQALMKVRVEELYKAFRGQ